MVSRDLENANMNYIHSWSLNAKQHFEDGDYDWICDKLSNYKKILEIGCGAGYSTRTFLRRGFDVIATDLNPFAIEETKHLVLESSCTSGRIAFQQVDVVHEMNVAIRIAKEADIMVLCNPGGNCDDKLTCGELRLLKICGFSDNEIDNSSFDLLHKWTQIFGACGAASLAEKPILIVERVESKEAGDEQSKQIAADMGLRLINTDYRTIRKPPEGGVYIRCGDNLMWMSAMYFPR